MPPIFMIRNTLLSALALAIVAPCPTSEAGFLFGPYNYAECILERLEDVQNDLVAISETSECRKEFPDSTPPLKISPFLFGPKTVAECVAEYAESTPSSYAANQIREACFQLYPETLEGD